MRNGTIFGGNVLSGNGVLEHSELAVEEGLINGKPSGGYRLNAEELLVLPGIIDVHGDAFERQIMPRPGVGFPIEVALLDTDRQLVSNGITTAFHAVTWSWEPGLRNRAMAETMANALTAMKDRLSVDTRFHLRHECHNLGAEEEILSWIGERRIAVLSFNDHMHDTMADSNKPAKVQKYLDRTGLDRASWDKLVDQTAARGGEVPASIVRLAEAARQAGIPMMSHDDMSPEHRDEFHALGVTVSEFPETEATAKRALDQGGAVVFGSPNVVRGKSHTTAPNATEMVSKRLCSVLASDYYYPALLLAPFKLAERLGGQASDYWHLISSGPARALGLSDKGELAPGKRADIVLVDVNGVVPRIVATIVAGRIVYLAEGERLRAA